MITHIEHVSFTEFQRIRNGQKTFFLGMLKDYQVNDMVEFRETEIESMAFLKAQITYVQKAIQGLKKGYSIVGFRLVDNGNTD